MPQSVSALPAVSPLTPAPITQVRGSSGIASERTDRRSLARRARLLGAQSHRAGHARPAQPAVPVGVLGQVLLVVVLGVEERAGGHDLGRDLAVAGAAQPLRE